MDSSPIFLDEETKHKLDIGVRKLLKDLGLLKSFKPHIRQTDSGRLVIMVVPKSIDQYDPEQCDAITFRGQRCRFPPEKGSRYCLAHQTLSKEKK